MSQMAWVQDLEQVGIALLTFVGVGVLGWTWRVGRARANDLRAVRDALLGYDGRPEYGLAAEPGLVERVAQIERKMGDNGGSTVFDALGNVKSNQKTLIAWAQQHVAEGNAIGGAMDRNGAALGRALAEAGVEWRPEQTPPFTPPRSET